MDERAPHAVPRRTASTPVGTGTITAEISIDAELRPGDALVAQRIETVAGPLVRLAYRRGDGVLRGPVSATPADARGLVEVLRANEAFKDVLPF